MKQILEFIKLINCLCIRVIKLKVVVGSSTICFISLGNTKKASIKIRRES